MLWAALWGLLAGGGVVAGALLGSLLRPGGRAIGTVMSVGTGALLGAIGFELVPRAARLAGPGVVTGAFLGGAVAFTLADQIVDALGGQPRRRRDGVARLGRRAGLAILAGSLLDNVPESLALGVDLWARHDPSAVLLVGILLSNLPEGMSSAVGLKRSGYGTGRILLTWSAVAAAAAAGAALGFLLARATARTTEGALLAFTAGAVLGMAADTLMPQAYAEGGRVAGLGAAVGLLAAYLLSRAGP